MSRIALTLALAAVLAPIAGAQQPGMPGPGPMPMMGRGGGTPGAASMLLSHTGELKLTDQQVTRLAAVARRAAERRGANRNAIDSMRAKFRPGTQATPPAGPPPEARAMMERVRTQEHEDLRDALAVLTPDQQASAWEMVARRGMMERGAGRMQRMQGGRRGGMQPGGRGGQEGPGMAPGRPGMRQGGPPPAADSLQRLRLRQPGRRPEQ